VNFNVEVRQQFLVLLHGTDMPVRTMKGRLSRYNCCDYRSHQVLGKEMPKVAKAEGTIASTQRAHHRKHPSWHLLEKRVAGVRAHTGWSQDVAWHRRRTYEG